MKKLLTIFALISYIHGELVSLPTIDIEEELPIGTLIADFRQQFNLSNLKSYRCLLQTENVYFHIQSNQQCQLTTRTRIDRDTLCSSSCELCNITLKIEIVLPQNTSVFLLPIHILDINDNLAYFNYKEYIINVTEHVQLGTNIPLDVIKAIDYDCNSIHYELHYLNNSIIHDDDYFPFKLNQSINRNNQLNLIVQQDIDREQRDQYRLKLQANENSQSKTSTILVINILDINDNTCQFEKTTYRIKIEENRLWEKFLQVKATDKDIGINGEIRYSLAAQNSKKNFDYFKIDLQTGWLSLIKTLDYETQNMWKLVIQAQDNGSNAIPVFAYVIIDVEDLNDNAPILNWNIPTTVQLLNDTISLDELIDDLTTTITNETSSNNVLTIAIPENKPVGFVVANLVASDLDTPPLEPSVDTDGIPIPPFRVTIKLESQQSLPVTTYFQILGPFDSTFVLVTAHILDREIQSTYDLIVTVTDNGQPQLSTTYKLHIQVDDENDNFPIFDSEMYFVDIKENNEINATLIQVHATDLDIKHNGRITYTIVSTTSETSNTLDPIHFVWIDSHTGIIRANIQFDYEILKNFSIKIIATDNGKPKSHHASAIVNVAVIDENDNSPQFTTPTYSFSIYENNSPNTYIGQVKAIDLDSGLNGEVQYRLDSIPSNLFLITKDGKLYVNEIIDREKFDEYNFNVIAFDRGQPKSLSSKAKIHLKIYDVNDECPKFLFPNDNNDTLIIDRTYWHLNDFICDILIFDGDEAHHASYGLKLITDLNQLVNYQYLKDKLKLSKFDSNKFYLEGIRLYFNVTDKPRNNSRNRIKRSYYQDLEEGVYYLAFKVIDQGRTDFFDEKLLKLIVVNNYQDTQAVVKKYDYLGSHLNNLQARDAYEKMLNDNTKKKTLSDEQDRLLLYSVPSKFITIIVIVVLSIILIGITFIFISLLRRNRLKRKKHEKILTTSVTDDQHQTTSSSSTTSSTSSYGNILSSSSLQSENSLLSAMFKQNRCSTDKRQNLRVSNCYDFGDTMTTTTGTLSSSPTSLLLLNKETTVPIIGSTKNTYDACCLLEKLNEHEKDLSDEQRQKIYSSWLLNSTGSMTRSSSLFPHDVDTFHSLTRLPAPSTTTSANAQCNSNSNLESSLSSRILNTNQTRQNQDIPNELRRPHYTLTTIDGRNQQSGCTRASSDDGFCGSSDISDDCPEQLRPRTLSTNAYSPMSPNSVPYTLMKEGILAKQLNSNLDRLSTLTRASSQISSFTSLLNRLDNNNCQNVVGSLELTTDNSPVDEKDFKSRRVRFNLDTNVDTKNASTSQNSEHNYFKPQFDSNRTMSPSDTTANYALERFEKLYMTRDEANNNCTRTSYRANMLPTSYTKNFLRTDDDILSPHSSLLNKVTTFSSPNDCYNQNIKNNYDSPPLMSQSTSYNSTVV
ncbi:unnamed protein product [Didymodactylos carnosus]|uniref:Cadherin domain-containing protein n=1 Tax=Didymodactylos carnosus TaxID=1234261 RepID=A0A813PST4_9BILA|nr:unnamed protein product [Didymodactylos carnosus]CAF3535627.1 unnamed protein product [Didymodactylos carnosus]